MLHPEDYVKRLVLFVSSALTVTCAAWAIYATSHSLGHEIVPGHVKAPVMITVPASAFVIGKRQNHVPPQDTQPPREVTLDTYRIGAYLVTNSEYAAMLNWAQERGYLTNPRGGAYTGGTVYAYGMPLAETHSSKKDAQIVYYESHFRVRTREGYRGELFSMAHHPVIHVSWYGAAAYCNWLSEMHDMTLAYDTSRWQRHESPDTGYRLPTEAEWERAAVWDGRRYWRYAVTCDTLDVTRANYTVSMGDWGGRYINPLDLRDEPYTTPVGWYNGINPAWLAMPNIATKDTTSSVGCYDMAGNVREWCHDWYCPDYYVRGPDDNPTGPSAGSGRILRGGGSWNTTHETTLERRDMAPQRRLNYVGFRLAASLAPVGTPAPEVVVATTPGNGHEDADTTPDPVLQVDKEGFVTEVEGDDSRQLEQQHLGLIHAAEQSYEQHRQENTSIHLRNAIKTHERVFEANGTLAPALYAHLSERLGDLYHAYAASGGWQERSQEYSGGNLTMNTGDETLLESVERLHDISRDARHSQYMLRALSCYEQAIETLADTPTMHLGRLLDKTARLCQHHVHDIDYSFKAALYYLRAARTFLDAAEAGGTHIQEARHSAQHVLRQAEQLISNATDPDFAPELLTHFEEDREIRSHLIRMAPEMQAPVAQGEAPDRGASPAAPSHGINAPITLERLTTLRSPTTVIPHISGPGFMGAATQIHDQAGFVSIAGALRSAFNILISYETWSSGGQEYYTYAVHANERLWDALNNVTEATDGRIRWRLLHGRIILGAFPEDDEEGVTLIGNRLVQVDIKADTLYSALVQLEMAYNEQYRDIPVIVSADKREAQLTAMDTHHGTMFRVQKQAPLGTLVLELFEQSQDPLLEYRLTPRQLHRERDEDDFPGRCIDASPTFYILSVRIPVMVDQARGDTLCRIQQTTEWAAREAAEMKWYRKERAMHRDRLKGYLLEALTQGP